MTDQQTIADQVVERLKARFESAGMSLMILKGMGLVTEAEAEMIDKRIKKGRKRYGIQ